MQTLQYALLARNGLLQADVRYEREADIADCPVEKVLSELSKGRSYLPCLILTV
jgi:hypothetical protein